MTDNEIKSALDWCEQFENNVIFNGKGDKKCVLALQMMGIIRRALEGYNRQKEEIAKKDIEIDILIQKKESLSDEVFNLRAEVERLQEEKDNLAENK